MPRSSSREPLGGTDARRARQGRRRAGRCHMARMSKRLAVAAAMGILAAGACGGDADETPTAGSDGRDAPVAPASVGVVTVRLEAVDGVFLEGFEVGDRKCTRLNSSH